VITPELLHAIMPLATKANVGRFSGPLDASAAEWGIDSPQRVAAFLAQLAHESGSLRYVRELASGLAYEGRADLGNTQPGDGVKFKGRGLIQITGRANYLACGAALGVELIDTPERLEDPDLAARSAGWFWSTRKLNELADAGDFRKITRRINGGYNGWDDRLAYYERAKAALGVV
jgi:putative chitinase